MLEDPENPIKLKVQIMYSDPSSAFQIHCEDPWFSLIRQGLKSVEGRKNTHSYKKLQVGSFINFSNGKESFMAVVTEVRSYSSLEKYLEDVTVDKALPGIVSLEEALKVYYQWSAPEKINQYGFLGIFIRPIVTS